MDPIQQSDNLKIINSRYVWYAHLVIVFDMFLKIFPCRQRSTFFF